MSGGQETDKYIEIWKIKKLIKALEAARGNGTSMISLIMPPRDQISRVTKMLEDEFGTASNINRQSVLGAIAITSAQQRLKCYNEVPPNGLVLYTGTIVTEISQVTKMLEDEFGTACNINRQSVLRAIAITSAQQRLKRYNEVPPNGLVLYTGTIVTDDGEEKNFTIDFEPFKPINASLYLCDNKFHTEALNELLESDDKFGFIIMDGNGTLFGTLSGNTWEVLYKFTVDLPTKNGWTDQSGLRLEMQFHYVIQVAMRASLIYINHATKQPNVSGLIVAVSPHFKTNLILSLDPCLHAKLCNVVDGSYGGEIGFHEAVELSSEILSNVKFIQEKRLIKKYFRKISKDTRKYVFGVDNTLTGLRMGAIKNLIVWEHLAINRYILKNCTTGETLIKFLSEEQEVEQSNFQDSLTLAELEVLEKTSLLEWFANEYKSFGCTLEFVTNQSREGYQFCRAFEGVGGILRYPLDLDLSDDDE